MPRRLGVGRSGGQLLQLRAWEQAWWSPRFGIANVVAMMLILANITSPAAISEIGRAHV